MNRNYHIYQTKMFFINFKYNFKMFLRKLDIVTHVKRHFKNKKRKTEQSVIIEKLTVSTEDLKIYCEKSLGIRLEVKNHEKIALGIVTYNNKDDELRKCLTSCKIALRQARAEEKSNIFIIDNGRPTSKAIIDEFNLLVIDNNKNLGFGAGHNVLMEKAFGENYSYYIATNPDGMYHPDCISALLRASYANDDSALMEATQFPEEHPKIFDITNFTTPWVSGACLFVTNKIYKAIGGFDDAFFMYCEDVDISWRARHAGFKVMTIPNALFFHPVTDREYKPLIHKFYLTSGLILARKWSSPKFESIVIEEFNKKHFEIPSVTVPVFDENSNIPDFSHMFSFGETRW